MVKLDLADSLMHRAILGLAFVVLSTNCSWQSVYNLHIWVHSASIQLRMAELAFQTRLKFDAEWVVDFVLVAKYLFIHVDITVV